MPFELCKNGFCSQLSWDSHIVMGHETFLFAEAAFLEATAFT